MVGSLTGCSKINHDLPKESNSGTAETSSQTTSTSTATQPKKETTPTTTTTPPETSITIDWTVPDKNVEQYKKDFVKDIYTKAKALEQSTKVPAAIVTAQACQESGYGASVPIDKYTGQISYNLFGVKGTGPAGSVLCQTFEYENGQKYYIDDYFKAYNSYDESIIGHAEFLQENSRYSSLFESDDPTTWAYGLQSAGYATDPNYAENLISVMNYWGIK